MINEEQNFIFIDGKKVPAGGKDSILISARKAGIILPSLCYTKKLKPEAECGICTVEIEGSPKLVRACSTIPKSGAKILTNTDRVVAVRNSVLELLVSNHTGDCIAPCKKACPANTNCQEYVSLTAKGEGAEALRALLENLPMPHSIGRICPHPCEEKCNRAKVDEAISIAALKSFVAEKNKIKPPKKAPNSLKKVAIVGGGPGGLTCGYYLTLKGHSVTIFEKNKKMGGMLRYGVPQYRLPNSILDRDISFIKSVGINFVNNTALGKDVFLENLQSDFDAVILAVGASVATPYRVKGKEKKGVIDGIDFLASVSGLGEEPLKTGFLSDIKGKVVAVLGGGDTAMDACRTAVRLGAKAVYNIYRRTEAQMPANKHEIKEAKEEGVSFKFLVDPIEILGESKVDGLLLQKMQLGEVDTSGRRSPVPIVGQTEKVALDTLIVMIGQTVEKTGLDAVEFCRNYTIKAGENTFTTNLEKVFAIGDCTNKGASIAIEAISEGKNCAVVVDKFLLTGEIIPYKIKQLSEISNCEFTDIEKQPRVELAQLSPKERKNNFDEVNKVLSIDSAKKEASRCLECGCLDLYDCKLLEYSKKYNIDFNSLVGEKTNTKVDLSHKLFSRDMNKCILCGICVKLCKKYGAGVLGLLGRGFNTAINTELEKPIAETACVSCGNCVLNCPTGAITLKAPLGGYSTIKSITREFRKNK